MLNPSPWDCAVAVRRHHYYERKAAFEMASDMYEEWAAFAVEEGDFSYRIGDEEGHAYAGQLVVCPPGIVFHRHTERPISFHYVLFHWIDRHGELLPAENFDWPARLDLRDRHRFDASLSALRHPADDRHPAYLLWRDHVWLDLFRLYATESSLPPEPKQSVRPDERLENARRLLDAICEEPVAIGAIAKMLGMSAVQFSRRFQQVFGMKPSSYAERVKLRKVCQLLTHTGMTLEQIALACGFNNGFYLSRYFSAKMGMPPSEYRAMYKV